MPLGEDRWLATVHTTGPWDERAQHGGPPSALLGRAMQRCDPREDMIVTRFTTEILSSIPVGEVEVRARVARPGRSVQLLEAVLTAGGREVAWARAWRVLRTGCPDTGPGLATPPPLPEARRAAGARRLGGRVPVGHRVARGPWRLRRARPATVWTRMRYPLVPGEEPSPLERVLAVADSGNGVSGELDLRRWLFINPELSVHLFREPAGEWICLDAQSNIAAGGTGLATSVLSDRHRGRRWAWAAVAAGA